MSVRVWITAAFVFALACLSFGLKIGVEPIFPAGEHFGTMAPVRVVLESPNADAVGDVVSFAPNGYEVRTRVEVPRGTTREVVAYVWTTSGGGGGPFGGGERPGLRWEGTDGRQQISTEAIGFGPSSGWVAISDTPGLMNSLKVLLGQMEQEQEVGSNPMDFMSRSAAVVAPGSVPLRARALAFARGVILADGTERLKDEEVASLRRYAMYGGTLVFVGGASSPVLKDPRWADLLPVTVSGARQVTWQGRSLTVQGYELRPGADRVSSPSGLPESVAWPVGAGMVQFLPFNPFEVPLQGTSARDQFLMTLGSLPSLSVGPLLNWRTSSRDFSAPRLDHNVRLPSVGVIGLILGLFWLIAIPVNLIVLARMGKSEWAWFTIPALSLLASVGIASQAQTLGAENRRQFSGEVVFTQGSDDGVARGFQFYYSGAQGIRDLKMRGVESLTPEESGSNPFTQTASFFEGQLRDDNGISGRAVALPGFRAYQARLIQAVRNEGRFEGSARLVRLTNETAVIRVRFSNGSDETMRQVVLILGGATAPVTATLEAGRTFEGDVTVRRPTNRAALEAGLGRGTAVIRGEVPGTWLGIQDGVPNRRETTTVMYVMRVPQ